MPCSTGGCRRRKSVAAPTPPRAAHGTRAERKLVPSSTTTTTRRASAYLEQGGGGDTGGRLFNFQHSMKRLRSIRFSAHAKKEELRQKYTSKTAQPFSNEFFTSNGNGFEPRIPTAIRRTERSTPQRSILRPDSARDPEIVC
jgi:hypothetical protein